MDDALRLTRHLSDAGFRNADRRYRGIKPGHEFNLYAPDHDRAVDLVWKPDRLPAAVTDAVSLLDDLRTHAAETGIDPFSNLAHRVVRPVLVHVHRRRAPDYSQVVSIFDNGALELRRIPASYSGAVQPWAASRRVRSGTMVELRGLVGAFDAERHPEPFVALGDTHELITARTQQSFRAIPSSAARALIERAERIVAPLDRLA